MSKIVDKNIQLLGKVAHIIDPHPSHRAPEEVREGVPFAGIGDLNEAGELLSGKGRIVPGKTLIEHSLRYKLTENTIGFGRVATIGKVIDFRKTIQDLTISPTMAIIELFAVDKQFLLAALEGEKVRKKIEQWLTGSTRSSLGIELLREIPLPEFDPPSQKKIGKIRKAIVASIEKTEALIEKYEKITAGLMHDLFSRGIGADGKLRPPRDKAPELYHETSIGWIPKEWEPLKLKDILKDSGGYLQTGPFGSQLHSHEYTHEGVPVVMPQDINEGKIDEFQIARITEKRAQTLMKHRLKIGDIIIARRGELSRAAAITDIEKGWVCGTGCFLLRLGGSNLDARYFSLMYRHPIVQKQVEGLAVGSTMPSLNNEIMGKLVFPYMKLSEQTAISDKIQLTENKIITLRYELEKLQKQKIGLMHDLLTGNVEVKANLPEVVNG